MNTFSDLISKCAGKHVYIQTHNFPDPDAIASGFGLQRLLTHFDIESTLCYYGTIDKISTKKMVELFDISIHSYDEIEANMQEEDYIICVDSQKNAGNILDFVGDEIAAIDHHPTVCKVGYYYSDIRMVGSCATLIAEYYAKLHVPMEQDVASALLYGMKMDTLNFTRGVTKLDIEMFGFLFDKANQEKIISLERNTMELKDLRAYGDAIENIEVYGHVGIAAISFPCPDALVATISDFMLELDEVDISVVYSYRENGLKFSIRSEKAENHAGEIIRMALDGIGSGGGHASMAGGFIPKENYGMLHGRIGEEIRGLFLEAVKGGKKRHE